MDGLLPSRDLQQQLRVLAARDDIHELVGDLDCPESVLIHGFLVEVFHESSELCSFL